MDVGASAIDGAATSSIWRENGACCCRWRVSAVGASKGSVGSECCLTLHHSKQGLLVDLLVQTLSLPAQGIRRNALTSARQRSSVAALAKAVGGPPTLHMTSVYIKQPAVHIQRKPFRMVIK